MQHLWMITTIKPREEEVAARWNVLIGTRRLLLFSEICNVSNQNVPQRSCSEFYPQLNLEPKNVFGKFKG